MTFARMNRAPRFIQKLPPKRLSMSRRFSHLDHPRGKILTQMAETHQELSEAQHKPLSPEILAEIERLKTRLKELEGQL